VDAVIAVDVGSTSSTTARRVREKGFATVFMRSVQLMMRSLQQMQLSAWQGPPLLLIRPPIWRLNWFSFAQTRAMIHAGYTTACEVLDGVGDALSAPSGVFPRRHVEVLVDRARCTGCGMCVALAPDVMQLTPEGKAAPVAGRLEWSRADGAFVTECPEHAITVEVIDPDGGRHRTMEHPVLPD
jgi:ferredoxin